MKLVTALASGLVALGSLAGFATANPVVKRAALTQVTNFGDNASGTLMYIYVPTKLAAKPAIVVAIHYCTGTASAYYTGTPYATLAEQYGFIVIYPQSPYSGTCWDVSSTAALTHGGGADSNSIANMVTYTISQYNADSSKVFVTGSSSGAMMTVSNNVSSRCQSRFSLSLSSSSFFFFFLLLLLLIPLLPFRKRLIRTRVRTSLLQRIPTCSRRQRRTRAFLPGASTRAPSMAGTRRAPRASRSTRRPSGPTRRWPCIRVTRGPGPR
jgi:hypothetical protein